MEQFLGVVKHVALIQLVSIFLFVFFMYLARIYFFARLRKKNVQKEIFSREFRVYFEEKKSFSAEQIKKFKKDIHMVFKIMKELEYSYGESTYFPQFITYTSTALFKPAARKLYRSRKWFNRYYAVRCFGYGFDEEDVVRLAELINDSALLICINASQIAIRVKNVYLINHMISHFARGRHLQQSFFAQVIEVGHCEISEIVIERIQKDSDPYVKAFCYRLLYRMRCTEWFPEIEKDISSGVTNLVVGVLMYLPQCENEHKEALIYGLAWSSTWEIRAAVAKALGKIHTQESVELLAKLLEDKEWWVRINSANSLYQLGDEGIKILRAQSPEKDKFAYETAQKVLMTGN